MLLILACPFGVFVLLMLAEYLSSSKMLRVEVRRKFVHILVGSFVAIWPWLIDWPIISLLGFLMFIGVWVNRHRTFFGFNSYVSRKTDGDYFFAIAIVLCSLLTTNKVFFALAILHMAICDGVAAIAGSMYKKGLAYYVFGHKKTIFGSFAFWFCSVIILGFGLLYAHETISLNAYTTTLILLPPILTILENISFDGSDNLTIPIMVLLALSIAQNY